MLSENGTAKSWGYNQTGQLGHGHRDKELTIRPIIGLEGHTVLNIPFYFSISDRVKRLSMPFWDRSRPFCPRSTMLPVGKRFGISEWVIVMTLQVCDDDENDGISYFSDMKFTFHHPTPTKVLKKVYVGRETGIKKIVPAAQFCLWISGLLSNSSIYPSL